MKRILYLIMCIMLTVVSISANHTLTATMYDAHYFSGRATASGDVVNPRLVENGNHRWVALSRDMFNKGYDFGDEIYVETDIPSLKGVWVVMDKMGARHTNAIDFLMTKKSSKGFGGKSKVKIKMHKKRKQKS